MSKFMQVLIYIYIVYRFELTFLYQTVRPPVPVEILSADKSTVHRLMEEGGSAPRIFVFRSIEHEHFSWMILDPASERLHSDDGMV